MTAIESQSDPEYMALLESVRANPDDDAIRLIISDWLEENGEEERAEFIRVQIELAKNNPFGGGKKYGERRDWLRHREVHLLNLGPGGGGRICQSGNWWKWGGRDINLGRRDMSDSHRITRLFSRGFLAEVHLSCREFMGGTCDASDPRNGGICPQCKGTGHIEGVARELFLAHPITTVRLIDKRPGTFRGLACFFWEPGISFNDPRQLPFSLTESVKWESYFYGGLLIYRFDTEAAALDALSAACVSYGRSLVGLPALDTMKVS